MASDASIYSMIRPPQAGTGPLEQYSQGLQLRHMLDTSALSDLQRQQLMRQMDEEKATSEAYSSSGGDATKLRDLLYGKGLYKPAIAAEKAALEKREKEGAIKKTEVETHGAQIKQLRDRLASVTDDNGLAALREETIKVYGPQAVASMPQTVSDPGFGAWREKNILTADELVKRLTPDYKPVAAGGTTVIRQMNPNAPGFSAEPVAHTQTPDSIASNATTVRGQNLTHAAATQPVWDEQRGAFITRPGVGGAAPAGGATAGSPRAAAVPSGPRAIPVAGANGEPLGRNLKDIPQSALTGMMENNRSLNKVDQAIAAIGGDASGVPAGVIADKDATGVKGYLPNFALNRFDPKGTDTRAIISDIGSLKIHDRSGAAVTASESPRLMPFIPLATDDATTVAKKLSNFKREYELMQRETGDYYNEANGFKSYKPAKMATQGAPQDDSKVPVRIKGDDGYAALPSGSIFIGPDGQKRRKP